MGAYSRGRIRGRAYSRGAYSREQLKTVQVVNHILFEIVLPTNYFSLLQIQPITIFYRISDFLFDNGYATFSFVTLYITKKVSESYIYMLGWGSILGGTLTVCSSRVGLIQMRLFRGGPIRGIRVYVHILITYRSL